MSVRSCNHKHMKELVAVASKVEEPGFPPLGNPGDIDDHPKEVEEAHANLIPQRLHANRLVMEEDDLVSSGNDPRHSHGRKGDGSHGSVLGGLEHGHKRNSHSADSNDRDSGQVDVSPDGLAQEDVIDRGEEAGGDHGGDAGVVQAP